MSMYKRKADIIIKNGTIVDGSGTPAYYADIAIRGDKIDYIGNLDGVDAPLVIDATHKYVTPGFIEPHSHSDMTIWANPTTEASIRQGVTTEVVGNCGFSMRHRLGKTPFDKKGESVKCVYDMMDEKNIPEGAMAAVLDKMDAMGCSENTAWLCGHNDLRVIAGVNTVEATDEQFEIMAKFLREAMEAGFIGFSTGLEFDPGVMCKPEEVERLAMIAAEYDANYSTHMRDEGTYILEAVNEFLNVIRKTGMRGQVSHLNVKYDNGIPNEVLYKAMQMLKDAREIEHLNVFADMLSTTFAVGGAQAMLPSWLYADGWDKAREILVDPIGREKVKKDLNRYWRFLASGQWDRLLYVKPYFWEEVANTPFNELVEKWGKDPADCFLDIFAAAPTIEDVRNIEMIGIVFHEQTLIDTVINDPIYMWQADSRSASVDGPVAPIIKQCQDFMGYINFFTRYVKELGVISIEAAVNKATHRVAKHFNLRKRGLLQEGYFADINVFDLNNLEVKSTHTDTHHYSEGMEYVIVNGVPTIAKGEHTGARAGKVLRNIPTE